MVETIITLSFIGITLLYIAIAAAVLYHLRRYRPPDEPTHTTMTLLFMIGSIVLFSIATYFFLLV